MGCAVCLQVRDVQSGDLSDVLWRDQDEVGEEQAPKNLEDFVYYNIFNIYQPRHLNVVTGNV